MRQRGTTPSRSYHCQLPFSAAPATSDLVSNRNTSRNKQKINFQTLETYYHLNKIGISPSHILSSTRLAIFQVTFFPAYSYAGSLLRLCLNINLTRRYFWCNFSAQEKRNSSSVGVIATGQPPSMVHPPSSGAWLVNPYHVIFLIIFILGPPNNNRPPILQQRNVSPGSHWISIANNCPRPRPVPNIKVSASIKTMTSMMQTRSGRGSTAMSRELDEIRLLNKKNHQQE